MFIVQHSSRVEEPVRHSKKLLEDKNVRMLFHIETIHETGIRREVILEGTGC